MRNSQKSTKQTLFQIALATTLALCLTATAQAADIRTDINAPIMVGGHLFDGGRLELAPAAQDNLMAVLIDGQQVALVFRHTVDRLPSDVPASFLLRADLDGNQHLLGVYWTDSRSGRTEQRLFRIAAVAPADRDQAKVARLAR